VIRAEQLGDYLQNILNTLSEPIMLLDKDHVIRSVNTAFVKLSRISQRKLINTSLYAIKAGA